ncbi:MAG: flippase-like domain-containing protein [Desulfurococcales archaeon]|nr:flippase-like domain-containing protein [Desulfurococcales archaeon]
MYINSQRSLVTFLKHLSLSVLVCLIFTMLLFQLTNGLLLRELASKFGVHLKPIEWVGLPYITTMGNYITPFSGGMLARATYLKYRHSFPFAKFVSTLGASYLIYFWISTIAGIADLAVLGAGSSIYWKLMAFFFIILVLVSALAMFPSIKLPWNNKLVIAINSSLEGWVIIRSDWLLLARLSIYTLFSILLNGISFWLGFSALLGTSPSFGIVFLISLLAGFTILIRITPGNFGISEAIVSLTSGILNIGAGIGLMAMLVIRAASLVPVFTLGPIFSFLLTKEIGKHR